MLDKILNNGRMIYVTDYINHNRIFAMAINYKKTAEEIINTVNKENIISATFCATRLRLIVKDRESIKIQMYKR